MNSHLSEHELSAAAAVLELDASARRHLDSCIVCREAVRSFRVLSDRRRAVFDGEAPDWARQQRQILDQLPATAVTALPRPWRPWRWLAAAAALAAAIGLGGLLRSGRAPAPARDIQVEKVLAEVDALLADDSIPGLWPADPISDTDELEGLVANGRS